MPKNVSSCYLIHLAQAFASLEKADASIEQPYSPARAAMGQVASEIARTILFGHKIAVIKHVREVTELGLKDAKDLVERIA